MTSAHNPQVEEVVAFWEFVYGPDRNAWPTNTQKSVVVIESLRAEVETLRPIVESARNVYEGGSLMLLAQHFDV